MTTALQLITSATRLIGVARKGEQLDADEAVDGLDALNDLLASWSSSSLFLLSRDREIFTPTAQAEHTIGIGKDFDTVAPMQIVDAYIRDGDIDHKIEIINDETYRAIAFKETQGGYPRYLNYSKTGDYGVIRLYPIPSSGGTLHLLSEKTTTEIAGLSTTVELPNAGWKRAVKYNLAIELAPYYGEEPSNAVSRIAVQALKALKRETLKQRSLSFRPSMRTIRNIYTGWENQ